MLSKRVTQILQIGMQKDIVLLIVAESLQITSDKVKYCFQALEQHLKLYRFLIFISHYF
ncbi:hypothetical protein [Helicobacter magdeburgensis]|uniref:hypothetical protein n=1 Tax=Helicobacter magdeburgensis TaxID=471858 RepID=UPI001F1FA901|nr:hypothetical protein [Helicobacter magdeburgensis]